MSAETEKVAELLKSLRTFPTNTFDASGPEVVIGDPRELTPENLPILRAVLREFMPWKKGPFRIFGESIDAEWRSDWKWERVLPHISLEGQTVADIGCHNGYYMFRMCEQRPAEVIGFEPILKHKLCFDFLQSFAQKPQLRFELMSVEAIDSYPKTFDTIFCLGILYHHTNPVGILRKLHQALNPGGSLIIDCQGIPGNEPVALVPESKYAGAAGMWFLPTLPALLNWITRSGFHEPYCFYKGQLSSDEQRATQWAPGKSLENFLLPTDNQYTVETYPRPWRFYVIARK